MDNPWTGEKVVDYHHTFKLDMADYEPVIKILRIFQVIFFIIALMLITRQQMIKRQGYINYFVPVGICIKIGEAWLAAIVVFYLWSVVARWIKLIE